MSTIKVGQSVSYKGSLKVGTVTKLLGKSGIGGGVHARVVWARGGWTSVVRVDLLTNGFDETIAAGIEVSE